MSMKSINRFKTSAEYEAAFLTLPEISLNYVDELDGLELLDNRCVIFTAENAGSTIRLSKLSTYQTLEYSTDREAWNNMDTSTTITLANVGDKVYIRGILSGDNTSSNRTQFRMSGSIAAIGNCNALWDYRDLDAPLKNYCGHCMFFGCTSLTTAPELPATIMKEYCYADMFSGCSNLTTAPALPATTLADKCYQLMFNGCTSLTKAPELPATTLADYCYENMFYGCTSLTTAPKLPATKLANFCYEYMFKNCTSLNNVTCLATDISAGFCTDNWLSGVSSVGTFTKAAGFDGWESGTSGIPSGWTIQDYVE